MRAEERRAETGAGAATSDVARKLRALGYVAGPSAAPSESSPNPADMMTAWSRFEEAVGHLSGPRDKDALRALDDLARSHPEAPVFQTTLAAALAERGRHRAALAIYRKVVERWPGDSMSFHDLAVSARAAGLVDEAMRAERAALAIDERNALAHNGLGLLLVDANRPAEAAVSFRRALELDPTNPQPAVNLGNALRASGDERGAERAYRRALDLDPEWPDALNGLAVLLVQRGTPADAIPLLQRALTRDSGLVEARLNLGIAAQQAGDLTLARESYRAVLRAPAEFARERRAAATLLGNLPGKG
jgi:tetratricopeptide (TPR) repeat protein